MVSGNHMEGFENEERFRNILGEAYKVCPSIKSRVVERIIEHFDPEYTGNLFKQQPCVRRLKYTGFYADDGELVGADDEFFKIGEIYTSIDFTGGTYTIKGYKNGERRIGCAYFEWIK